jgi:FkbM family methyltransferase
MDNVLKSKTLTYYGYTAKLLDDPRYDIFYQKLVSQRWEPATFDVLSRLVDADTTYIDIGAWIGVTPLWAAQKARHVVAVEPDPFCTQVLRFLMSENGTTNITLMEGALANERIVALGENGGFGSSESSLLSAKSKNTVSVAGISVAEILKRAGTGSKFCKIDIEGFEYEMIDKLVEFAVPEMKALQLAIHPQLLIRSKDWSPVHARFRAAFQTWHLVRKLQNKEFNVAANGRSPFVYILKNILFAWKVRGTDLLASRVVQ